MAEFRFCYFILSFCNNDFFIMASLALPLPMYNGSRASHKNHTKRLSSVTIQIRKLYPSDQIPVGTFMHCTTEPFHHQAWKKGLFKFLHGSRKKPTTFNNIPSPFFFRIVPLQHSRKINPTRKRREGKSLSRSSKKPLLPCACCS